MESQTKGHSKASGAKYLTLREARRLITGQSVSEKFMEGHHIEISLTISWTKEGISIPVTLPFRKPRGVPILEKSRLGPNTHARRVYLIQKLPCQALVMSMRAQTRVCKTWRKVARYRTRATSAK
ncbi:unnamed protein product [Clonostachys rosea f. rosea IK726]|uniref:Uncharacterized protein n=1 Tax=Clonostachys rosea f. rosea IK726 TaxID=1349383 RepID=A0ACA9UTF2_BIOOC|nr:unnamed protein product [Clonostachys rosea f. rosea IK726]